MIHPIGPTHRQHREGLPPNLHLPPGTKPIVNLSGHFVLLNPLAATKLKYWKVYRTPAGEFRTKFNCSNDRPLSDFGSFTILHLRPYLAETGPIASEL